MQATASYSVQFPKYSNKLYLLHIISHIVWKHWTVYDYVMCVFDCWRACFPLSFSHFSCTQCDKKLRFWCQNTKRGKNLTGSDKIITQSQEIKKDTKPLSEQEKDGAKSKLPRTRRAKKNVLAVSIWKFERAKDILCYVICDIFQTVKRQNYCILMFHVCRFCIWRGKKPDLNLGRHMKEISVMKIRNASVISLCVDCWWCLCIQECDCRICEFKMSELGK